MARILILGGGFAAISAAETLAASLDDGHEIMIVSKSPEFTFFPAIIPMVFGDFRADEISFDLGRTLAEHGIAFIQGDVRAINVQSRSVEVSSDRITHTITFDYLIVAVGRRLAPASVPGLSEHAHHILTVDAALKFKQAIANFESGSIVVGLCPDASLPVPVCETALALSERFPSEIKHGDISISVVVPATLEKAMAGAALFRDVEAEFDRRGIRLVQEFAVTEVQKDRIVSVSGANLSYDLAMLVPPFRGQLSLHNLGPLTDFSGFARVNPLMQVEGLDRVYAAGEIVSMSGPKFGYMAMRQGHVAAANILAQLRNEPPAVEYSSQPAWVIAEQYTDPVYFHYGLWDESLSDFDENALFGIAGKMRDRYGHLKNSESGNYFAAT